MLNRQINSINPHTFPPTSTHIRTLSSLPSTLMCSVRSFPQHNTTCPTRPIFVFRQYASRLLISALSNVIYISKIILHPLSSILQSPMNALQHIGVKVTFNHPLTFSLPISIEQLHLVAIISHHQFVTQGRDPSKDPFRCRSYSK